MEKALVDERFKDIEENYKRIKENIQKATLESGRDEGSVRLMGVTKTVDSLYINHALSLGIDLIGENRVQEYLGKRDELHLDGVEKHLIGHLQTNKVKYIINDVTLIQSVDNLKLAHEISRLAVKNNKTMNVLVEINIGDEATKSGVSAEMAEELVRQTAQLPNVSVKGLMAIPPVGSGEDVFEKMHGIFLSVKEKDIPNVSMDILSMGMSGDYELAIKHGSNLVRIGTKLFGARKYLED